MGPTKKVVHAAHDISCKNKCNRKSEGCFVHPDGLICDVYHSRGVYVVHRRVTCPKCLAHEARKAKR